jgi:hypothetical protein
MDGAEGAFLLVWSGGIVQNRTKSGKNRVNPEKISNFLWKSRFFG